MSSREDEIRERFEKATKGPWERSRYAIYDENENWLATTDMFRGPHNWDQGVLDADFIAHAITDIPYLLEELRKVREEVERLKGEIEHLRELCRKSVGRLVGTIDSHGKRVVKDCLTTEAAKETP